MNRREFLKLGGAVSAMLLLPVGALASGLASLATVKLGGKTFHGAADGRVYVSANDGQTWNLLADFGPGITVFSLTGVPGNRIYARLGFAGKSFGLVYSLKDGNWRTT